MYYEGPTHSTPIKSPEDEPGRMYSERQNEKSARPTSSGSKFKERENRSDHTLSSRRHSGSHQAPQEVDVKVSPAGALRKKSKQKVDYKLATANTMVIEVHKPRPEELLMADQRKEMERLIEELRARDRELNEMVTAHHQQLAVWELDRQLIVKLQHRCNLLEVDLHKQREKVSQLEDEQNKHNNSHSVESLTLLLQQLQNSNENLAESLKEACAAKGELAAREEELSTLLTIKESSLSDMQQELSKVRAKLRLSEIEAEENKSSSEQLTCYWKQEYSKLRDEKSQLLEECQEKDEKLQKTTEQLKESLQHALVLQQALCISCEQEKYKDNLLESLKSRQQRCDLELTHLRNLFRQQNREMNVLQLTLDSSHDSGHESGGHGAGDCRPSGETENQSLANHLADGSRTVLADLHGNVHLPLASNYPKEVYSRGRSSPTSSKSHVTGDSRLSSFSQASKNSTGVKFSNSCNSSGASDKVSHPNDKFSQDFGNLSCIYENSEVDSVCERDMRVCNEQMKGDYDGACRDQSSFAVSNIEGSCFTASEQERGVLISPERTNILRQNLADDLPGIAMDLRKSEFAKLQDDENESVYIDVRVRRGSSSKHSMTAQCCENTVDVCDKGLAVCGERQAILPQTLQQEDLADSLVYSSSGRTKRQHCQSAKEIKTGCTCFSQEDVRDTITACKHLCQDNAEKDPSLRERSRNPSAENRDSNHSWHCKEVPSPVCTCTCTSPCDESPIPNRSKAQGKGIVNRQEGSIKEKHNSKRVSFSLAENSDSPECGTKSMHTSSAETKRLEKNSQCPLQSSTSEKQQVNDLQGITEVGCTCGLRQSESSEKNKKVASKRCCNCTPAECTFCQKLGQRKKSGEECIKCLQSGYSTAPGRRNEAWRNFSSNADTCCSEQGARILPSNTASARSSMSACWQVPDASNKGGSQEASSSLQSQSSKNGVIIGSQSSISHKSYGTFYDQNPRHSSSKEKPSTIQMAYSHSSADVDVPEMTLLPSKLPKHSLQPSTLSEPNYPTAKASVKVEQPFSVRQQSSSPVYFRLPTLSQSSETTTQSYESDCRPDLEDVEPEGHSKLQLVKSSDSHGKVNASDPECSMKEPDVDSDAFWQKIMTLRHSSQPAARDHRGDPAGVSSHQPSWDLLSGISNADREKQTGKSCKARSHDAKCGFKRTGSGFRPSYSDIDSKSAYAFEKNNADRKYADDCEPAPCHLKRPVRTGSDQRRDECVSKSVSGVYAGDRPELYSLSSMAEKSTRDAVLLPCQNEKYLPSGIRSVSGYSWNSKTTYQPVGPLNWCSANAERRQTNTQNWNASACANSDVNWTREGEGQPGMDVDRGMGSQSQYTTDTHPGANPKLMALHYLSATQSLKSLGPRKQNSLKIQEAKETTVQVKKPAAAPWSLPESADSSWQQLNIKVEAPVAANPLSTGFSSVQEEDPSWLQPPEVPVLDYDQSIMDVSDKHSCREQPMHDSQRFPPHPQENENQARTSGESFEERLTSFLETPDLGNVSLDTSAAQGFSSPASKLHRLLLESQDMIRSLEGSVHKKINSQ